MIGPEYKYRYFLQIREEGPAVIRDAASRCRAALVEEADDDDDASAMHATEPFPDGATVDSAITIDWAFDPGQLTTTSRLPTIHEEEAYHDESDPWPEFAGLNIRWQVLQNNERLVYTAHQMAIAQNRDIAIAPSNHDDQQHQLLETEFAGLNLRSQALQNNERLPMYWYSALEMSCYIVNTAKQLFERLGQNHFQCIQAIANSNRDIATAPSNNDDQQHQLAEFAQSLALQNNDWRADTALQMNCNLVNTAKQFLNG
ncbi:expressed unknown protein [Seminavis robusta]|uniref:Uncharacterized protein n=1 Tax=Seminavis robusta TaxID=568900 RepID=A0A9N8E6D6_9STRA|nr:expressed unknown protein [Seminavis robusta]|eukprot:Sro670_g184630.1 n/a (258) ;mRNA; r:7066-7912